MKTTDKIMIVLLPILGAATGFLIAIGYNKIDMPEEIEQITFNAQKPDTLIGWQDKRGTIHIEFKH